MKKFLTLALMFSGLLFSCKKENIQADEQVGRPLTIRVPDFTSRHESINGRVNADSTLDGITDLYYISYDYTGAKVHQKHQVASDPDFGTIVDTLVGGNYHIVVIASQKPLALHTSTGGFTDHYFDPGMTTATNWRPFKDVLYKKESVTMPADGDPIEVDITLERLIGKLEVNILDALPGSSPYSDLSVSLIDPASRIDISNGYALGKSLGTTMDMTRINRYRFENFAYGIDDAFELRIDYQDKWGAGPLTKFVSGIVLLPNTKTVVSGYLYGPPAANSFQIKANQSWNSDSLVVTF